jgi:hypothetical protein
MSKKPELAIDNTSAENPEPDKISVAKPSAFNLDKFKSKRSPNIAGVETVQGPLPHHRISEANDFVRLHPDVNAYWSSELCFVSVPIKSQKKDLLHMIDEDLAMMYLPSKKIQRFRLALAAKPYDVFFLCQVPTQNTDNSWNESNLRACERAKTQWVEATSRKGEGVDGYKIDPARDPNAFDPPNWPKRPLDDLIGITFTGRMIDSEEHPGLLRLIGGKQKLS